MKFIKMPDRFLSARVNQTRLQSLVAICRTKVLDNAKQRGNCYAKKTIKRLFQPEGFLPFLLIAALSVVMTACGGGGDSGATADPVPDLFWFGYG